MGLLLNDMFGHSCGRIEIPQRPQECHKVSIFLQKRLRVTEHFIELVNKLLLGVKRLELLRVFTELGISRTAPNTPHDLPSHYLGILAVVRTGAKKAVQMPSTVSSDKLLQLGEYFFGSLGLEQPVHFIPRASTIVSS